MAVKFIDHSSPVWVSERSCSHSMTVFFLILHLLCFSVVYKIEFGSQVQDVGLFWERKGRLNYLLLDLFFAASRVVFWSWDLKIRGRRARTATGLDG